MRNKILVFAEVLYQGLECSSKRTQRIYVVTVYLENVCTTLVNRFACFARLLCFQKDRWPSNNLIGSGSRAPAALGTVRSFYFSISLSPSQAIAAHPLFYLLFKCAIFLPCRAVHDFRHSRSGQRNVEAAERTGAVAQSKCDPECGEARCRIAEPGPL